MAKKTTKKKKLDDFELAVQVSDFVEFEDIKLVSSECKQTPEAASGKHVLNLDCDVETEFDEKNNMILVFPKFSLTAIKENNEGVSDLSILAQFILLYKLKEDTKLTKKNFEAFGKINGVYNAWPYWREFVQNTASRMGLPSLVVPVFRLAKSNTGQKKTSKSN